MLLFCPRCSNMLTVSRTPTLTTQSGSPPPPPKSRRTRKVDGDDKKPWRSRNPDNNEDNASAGKNRFECRSCPYQFVLDRRFYERKFMKRKEVEDVLGGKGAWDNVDRTEVQCPNEKCQNYQAFFYQVQIRSADEPMTSFYKCTECATEWRD